MSLRLDVDQTKIAIGEEIVGVIKISNNSQQPVVVFSDGGLFRYLSFSFTDQAGAEFVYKFYGDFFVMNPLGKEEIIAAGATINGKVAPLAVIDERRLHPGTYTLKARFCYENINLESNQVKILLVTRNVEEGR